MIKHSETQLSQGMWIPMTQNLANADLLLLTQKCMYFSLGMRKQISRNAWLQAHRTPLHLAALQGHSTLASLLIGRGAVVDAKDENNMTPLHKAAIKVINFA